MIAFTSSRSFCGLLVPTLLGLALSSPCGAQEDVGITEITQRLLVFSTATGNVVASVGPDGALLIGAPSAASTPEISKILATRTPSLVRYVVIAPEGLRSF